MSNNIAIEFEHVSKQYRLGLVSTKTLSHDIRRFWITNVLGKEDPYLKIGETNDRASKGNSEYKNHKVLFLCPFSSFFSSFLVLFSPKHSKSLAK